MKTTKPRIKICGVRDPMLAKRAIQLGAHYIGLMFYPKSPRFVELNLAKQIAQQTKEAEGIPVAVFVDAELATIQQVCESCEIDTVQLHGKLAKKSQALLPDELHRIYVLNQNQQQPFAINQQELATLNPARDYLLFDSQQGGSGKSFDWEAWQYSGKIPFFIAGGLNAQNVQQAISRFKPYAVDVSSGVETAPGVKDETLIKQFIEATLC